MEIFNEISPLRAFLKQARMSGKTLGFVPTMGALHDGHLSLLKVAKLENDITICSIYVNPAQFNNPSDLSKYPRTIVRDSDMLKKVECDILFNPIDEEIYPDSPQIKFDFGQLDKVMEGHFRPGHFSGVALVVAKLFNIVEPNNVYFGQKDWQQFTIIKRMVQELKFNLELKSIPTTREADGLALSSRNLRLNPTQRGQAHILYEALSFAKEQLWKERHDFPSVYQSVQEMFRDIPGVRLEYFELVDSINLKSISNVDEANHPILCIAAYFGEVRLIDNMFLQ
ncbi:MAG TPA: pantoate--beta-alanine ligase [Cyclobacteriaceae bacterium]|nr:pantoate--beta-alanine ligase [Cyclobacteriaceae bacterium]